MVGYDALKALHVIFMVTFFAGTFYIVRLFIYHKEAEKKFDPDRAILIKQFMIMEKRLWYGITWPSMLLMTVFGVWLLVQNPILITEPWMHAKLGFVALLIVYHLVNQRLFARIRTNRLRWGSLALRLWNEGATVFLFAVVFLVMLRHRLGTVWGLLGALLLGVALMIAVMMYRKKRQGNGPAEGL
ncbi:MAG: CopD family protein [Flavobacteriales bacterium]